MVSKHKIIGIDASNIRGGGGIAHLAGLLRMEDPVNHESFKVIVWSCQKTLDQMADRPWLVKSHQPFLDRSLPFRIFWQIFRLSSSARMAGCDVLFVPGGSYVGSFRPTVTMSQNLLPFEWRELRRFGWSWMTLKLVFLRLTQSRGFRRTHGRLFLTHYARDVVLRSIKNADGMATIVPHGIEGRFFCQPREQLAIEHYSVDRPLRILYVSTVDVYKHQWHVAQAVSHLREQGFPVVLDLVGSAYPPALKKLKKVMGQIDPAGHFIRYHGPVSYDQLHGWYTKADLFLFASSCENMPNILLEAMASGLPIACSNRGPMPEILDEAGVYFDPENSVDIASALRQLILSPSLRAEKAKASFDRAKQYSWGRCAQETFGFLAKIAEDYQYVQ